MTFKWLSIVNTEHVSDFAASIIRRSFRSRASKGHVAKLHNYCNMSVRAFVEHLSLEQILLHVGQPSRNNNKIDKTALSSSNYSNNNSNTKNSNNIQTHAD